MEVLFSVPLASLSAQRSAWTVRSRELDEDASLSEMKRMLLGMAENRGSRNVLAGTRR